MERPVAEGLLEALVAAILDSIDGQDQGDRQIAGYACMVDADMQSTHGASITQAFLDDQTDDHLLYMPEDWPTEHHSRSFERASTELVRAMERVAGESYEARVRLAGEDVVSALEQARRRSSGLAHAVLMVVCPDGGGEWHSVEEMSVGRLNGPRHHQTWALEFGQNHPE